MPSRRWMTARTLMLSLALVALALGLAPAGSADPDLAGPPPLPSSFWGTAQVNGADVAEGTTITVGRDGVTYGTTQTLVDPSNGDSYYRINAVGDDSETPERDGGTAGEILEFTIAGLKADQTAVWQSGGNVNLDLTATGDLPTPGAYRLNLPLVIK